MKFVWSTLVLCTVALLAPPRAAADPYLCDASAENCRTRVLTLIANEKVGIDVSFWFMDDARYSNAIVGRWKAGVPVRVIMDPRANASKPANATILNQLQAAGIPMRTKSSGDIAHWKGMIFAGQQTAEFSGANYSPYEYTPQTPYVDYNDEVIYFSDEPDVVESLMTHFDDVWIDHTGYGDYANVVEPTVRTYPIFPIAPEFNFPPDDSYFDRLHPLLRAEAQRADGRIDVTMYRITDSREADDMIFAVKSGRPVRLYAEPNEYRNPARVDDSYNIDRMYMAGVQIRMRAHTGLNHQKTVVLYSQGLTVFGTSNWSTASDDNQLEVNYFTSKGWFLQFFHDLFERKWNNSHILSDGTAAIESTDFKPLPPDKPVYTAPALQATGASTSTALKWKAGYWARQYDIYVGVTPSLHLLKGNVNLGPSTTTSDIKSFTLPVLQPGTTYYWQIVSKTMANLTAAGPVWSFTTAGTAPPNVCADPAALNYTGPAPCTYTVTVPGTPAAPAPANNASGVISTPTLTWSSTSATSYAVLFGTTNPPPTAATGLAQAKYAPGTLTASTTYFWQVVATNSAGSTTGPVWTFTTAAAPPPSNLPPPWVDADIGAVGRAGTAQFSAGTFTVIGAGADIWNGVDAFHYVYQPITGDGQIVAHVASISNANQWSKAGVMIRNTLDANSAFAYMLVSASKGTAFHYRASAGAAATGVTTGASAAPMWLKIARSGNVLTGYQSTDGAAWTLIGSTTIAMNASVYVGLAVTSHNASATATGVFDTVSLNGAPPPPPPPPPPAPWTQGDIGAVGAAGSATVSSTTFSVAGAGADIWNTADAFHYVFQPMAGDGQVIARVASVQNVAAWSKAGVMIRDTTAPGSAYAFMLVSAGKGSAFQYRAAAGASAAGVTGNATSAPPLWVKVTRAGGTISGYQSADGVTWQLVGSTTVALSASAQVGLAVSSHTTTKTATAVFDNVAVTPAVNQPPTVTLTSPADFAEFAPGSDVVVAASASDPENQLARVDFYAGSTLIGSSSAAPFSATWPSVPVGTYTVTAVAVDAAGNTTTSKAATVTVNAGATPFFGVRNAFVIVLENHDWSDIAGNPLAPYINSVVLPQAAHAEQYFNPPGNHPSLPNYLWLEAGQNFGVTDDGSPAVHHQSTTAHLTTQLEAAGVSWKAYEEGIGGTSCPILDTGNYVTKHDPFVYFDDVTSGTSAASAHCIAHVRPYSELAGDLQNNTVPRYTFITPDICHDMHSCGVDVGDQWLSTELPRILASAAYQHAAVFITFDESEATGGVDAPIPMILLSPAAKAGYGNAVPYTHSSTLRTIQEIFGLTDFLGDAAAATDLADLFVQP